MLARLHSEDLHRRVRLFHGAGDAADQPSAADGNDDGFDVGMLLQNFEAERSLPRDDGIVIEGVDEREAIVFGSLDRLLVGFIVVRAVQRRPRRRKHASQKLW